MPLHEAFSKFKKTFTEDPLDAERPSDGAQVIPVVEGDETSEIKAKIYQQVMSSGAQVSAPGKVNKLMMFSPQLLQSSDVFASVTAYKDETCWRPDMAVVFNWMLDRADDSTIVAATDARSPKIRHHLLTIVYNHQTDEEQHLDNHIMYKAMPSKADIRFPRRKVYGAVSNVETVVGVLPVSRVRMKTRQRENFSACGETCTHT